MRILICHPSRNRAHQAARTAHKWLTSAANRDNITYILSIDTDDPQLSQYYDYTKGLGLTIVTNPNKTAIEAINTAVATQDNWDLVICLSDDFNQPPFHWDKALTKALTGKSDYVVKTQDGAQPWIITLPIMDRLFYNRFGYVYNPAYKHLFCDTELAHVGAIMGKTVTLDLKIPHNHYTTGKTLFDEVNRKNDATWEQGEGVYLENLLRHFDIPVEERVNPIDKVPAHHLQWLNSKGIIFEHA